MSTTTIDRRDCYEIIRFISSGKPRAFWLWLGPNYDQQLLINEDDKRDIKIIGDISCFVPSKSEDVNKMKTNAARVLSLFAWDWMHEEHFRDDIKEQVKNAKLYS